MAMNDRDVLGRDWDAMVRDMERSRRVEPRRMPWISAKQPYTKVEEAPDPDEMVLDLILGKGTGDWKKDLAFGLMGPAGGAATELSGGQSGVLDWLPGGGVAKAGVLAVPTVVKTLTKTGQRIAADDAVDITKMIAQSAIDRLARSGQRVTPDDISRAVAEEVDALGNFKGDMTIKLRANELAQNVLERFNRSISEGTPVNIDVRTPPVIGGLTKESLNENIASSAEREREIHRKQAKKRMDAVRSLFKELPEDTRNDIERRAGEAADKAVADAEEAGRIWQNNTARNIFRNNKYQAQKRNLITAILREREAAAKEPPKFQFGVSALSDDREAEQIIRDASNSAYREAVDVALKSGLSLQDAKKIGMSARRRAVNKTSRELGGDARASRHNATNAHHNNMRVARSIMSPELRESIERGAREAAEARRREVLRLGGTRKRASDLAGSAAETFRNSETTRILKELGFKNANDPRLAQYSQLRRDGNHVLATQPVQPAMAEAAAPVKGYVADVVEGAGKSMLDGIPDEEVEALLREYGETPTADRVFNREYLEELLREEGY